MCVFSALHYGSELHLDGEDADETITGGSIRGNTCTSTSDGNGSGIYITNGADLTYTGGQSSVTLQAPTLVAVSMMLIPTRI